MTKKAFDKIAEGLSEALIFARTAEKSFRFVLPDGSTLNAIVFEDETGLWVIQGVERDIAASAPSVEELPRAFERVVRAELLWSAERGRDGLSDIPPAPPSAFRQMSNV